MATNRSNRTRRNVPNNRSDEGNRRTGRGGEYRSEGYRDYERGPNGGSRYEEGEFEGGRRRNVVKRVGREVKDRVGSMDLDKALVLLHTALALAIVVKQTRSRGRPRKAEPFRSAMSVLNYYLNEGRELSEMQRATLEDIKEELRMLYNREEEEMMSPAG
jgi:hypothetical protein